MSDGWNGMRYKRFSRAQKTWGMEVIGGLSLRGAERVLDLGCGDGVLTSCLADRVPFGAVVGVDRSDSMIKEARTRNRFNVTFVKSDILDMNYRDEFDLVFSNAALHWVRDHEKVQGSIYKALRPGGVCRLQMGGKGNCPATGAELKKLVSEGRFAPFFRGWTSPWKFTDANSYRELMAALPYEEHRVWTDTFEWKFESKDELRGWAETTALIPFIAELDEITAREFREQALEAIAGATANTDGTHTETFERLNVFAVKGDSAKPVGFFRPIDLP